MTISEGQSWAAELKRADQRAVQGTLNVPGLLNSDNKTGAWTKKLAADGARRILRIFIYHTRMLSFASC